jgi:hypothetical protein
MHAGRRLDPSSAENPRSRVGSDSAGRLGGRGAFGSLRYLTCCIGGLPGRVLGERRGNRYVAPDSRLFADGLLRGERCNGGARASRGRRVTLTARAKAGSCCSAVAPGQGAGEQRTPNNRRHGIHCGGRDAKSAREGGFVLQRCGPGTSGGGATNPQKPASWDSLRQKRCEECARGRVRAAALWPRRLRRGSTTAAREQSQ